MHPVVLIPGDGIGYEVTAAVRKILLAAAAPLETYFPRRPWRPSAAIEWP
jgi:isocitrate/isopropylmalate dehydrogenase